MYEKGLQYMYSERSVLGHIVLIDASPTAALYLVPGNALKRLPWRFCYDQKRTCSTTVAF